MLGESVKCHHCKVKIVSARRLESHIRKRCPKFPAAALNKSGAAPKETRAQIRSATLNNGLGGRDALASEPLDRQVKTLEQRIQLESQRAIKKAVREFFVSPQERQFANLVEQLEEYKKYSITSAGVERERSKDRFPYVRVFQGGLPSLGKRAK